MAPDASAKNIVNYWRNQPLNSPSLELRVIKHSTQDIVLEANNSDFSNDAEINTSTLQNIAYKYLEQFVDTVNYVLDVPGKVKNSVGHFFFYMKPSLGLNGEEIMVCKFRTMKHGADKIAQDAAANNAKIDNIGKVISSELDNQLITLGPVKLGKITLLPKVELGKYMRKTGFDELPAISYNVWYKKDMKMMGTRPLPDWYWDKYFSPELKKEALEQKPGWAPNHYGRKGTFPEEVAKYVKSYKLDPKGTDKEYTSYFFKKLLAGEIKTK